MSIFASTDILIPEVESMEKWAVIACDQFSSQPEYWERVREQVGSAPSALHLILPEAELESGGEEEKTACINARMRKYLEEGIFRSYPGCYIYIERTLNNGCIRKGVAGVIDLEEYDYREGARPAIRATEKTVVERIPPRVKIRQNAAVELPHVLLLCDDEEKRLIESIGDRKEELPKLYDFELMEGGGHIAGWLVQGSVLEGFQRELERYEGISREQHLDGEGMPMVYAVGDGNHSLAAAKACYEELKKAGDTMIAGNVPACPARYALVELENIHDDALGFAPIHRIITETDPWKLLEALKKGCCREGGIPVTWYIGEESGVICLDRKNPLAVATLQTFLDEYLKDHPGRIDYIHGEDVLRELAGQQDAIGFLLPVMEKGQLFRSVLADGVLPRKTFSMGLACEKRYYLEGRKII